MIEPNQNKTENFYNSFKNKSKSFLKKAIVTGMIVVMGTGALISTATASSDFMNTQSVQNIESSFSMSKRVSMNFDMPDLKGTATAEEGTLDIETGKINLKNVVIDTGNNQLMHFDSMRIDDYKVDENNKIVAVNMVTSKKNLNGDINVQRIINDDEGFRVDIEIAEGEIESLQYLNAKSQNDEFAVSIYKGDINDPSSYRNEDANIDGKKSI